MILMELVEKAVLDRFINHNQYRQSLDTYLKTDPHLRALSTLRHQYDSGWWHVMLEALPGIYILTGGRQVGKSTSCKLLIKEILLQKTLPSEQILYLPCDEIYDAKELSTVLRYFIESVNAQRFLLIIDEITYVKHWERVIKALADEGLFRQSTCILTGSDALILKEAAMSFPGRRGVAAETDFHMYPLSFSEYAHLLQPSGEFSADELRGLFHKYLHNGGYLRAINEMEQGGEIKQATYVTYEQWIRGDFLKQNKNESYLLAVLNALLTTGVSQISFSKLTQKIGLISKDTCIDYCHLLERMDILFNLQAYDQNKKQGFPRKDRKFHFLDPLIYHTICQWLAREGHSVAVNESYLVEAIVAAHCHRFGKAYYFKGDGEIDVILLRDGQVQAIEVKWAEQVRPADLKLLKNFTHSTVLSKQKVKGSIEHIKSIPVDQFLLSIDEIPR